MKCFECGKVMGKRKGAYAYRESGLDNVILQGITIYKCECGEEVPEIPNMEGLHKAIAQSIANYPAPLSGPMFRFLRKELKLKAKELADMLGVSAVTISRWEKEKEPIGAQSDKLIRMIMIQTLEENCNIVFHGSIKQISGITRNREQAGPIKVDKKAWESFCEPVAV